VGAEIEMIDMPERERQMKKVLEPLRDLYDFIIIDCSPSLGLVTVNSLTASDSVIVPVQCEYFALEGLGKLLNTIKIVQQRLNPELVIEGMLLTMYDSRLRLANQVVEEVKTHFQQLVFDTVIHRNVALGEAPSHGQTIIMHDASSKGATNYLNLAREILQKNSLTRIPDSERTIAIARTGTMTKKKGLGRGLSALLEDPAPTSPRAMPRPERGATHSGQCRLHPGRADRAEPLPAAHPLQR
jgi:chromosome partitioning protein